MKIAFVGGGNMATALIGGLLKRAWRPEDIRVAEIDPLARDRLERACGIRASGSVEDAAAECDCAVLAVKPQSVRDAARSLAPFISDALVVSIAAGIRVSDLSRWLGGHRRVVRAMPNTPALALAGMTGLYAPSAVLPEDRARAEQILAAAGSTLWVASEERMDAVTAVSGSGPAYVFYFIESLQRAAVELGFSDEAARQLALETFTGAAKLAAESPDSAATLRERVTSKGGTTERALHELECSKVGDAIVRAVKAAAERSRELGDVLAANPPNSKG